MFFVTEATKLKNSDTAACAMWQYNDEADAKKKHHEIMAYNTKLAGVEFVSSTVINDFGGTFMNDSWHDFEESIVE